jgi:hypothetical protein
MKKIISILSLCFFTLATIACPVCERNQPKLLKGIVHGKGPDSNWDYVSVWITAIIAIITLFYTVKWLLKPGEKNNEHIKYSIFKN